MFGDRRLGNRVERDARLTCGGRRAPPALRRDQIAHGVLTGTDDLGRQPQRSGNHPAVDHHQTKVISLHPLLDQHLGEFLPRPCHRGGQLG